MLSQLICTIKITIFCRDNSDTWLVPDLTCWLYFEDYFVYWQHSLELCLKFSLVCSSFFVLFCFVFWVMLPVCQHAIAWTSSFYLCLFFCRTWLSIARKSDLWGWRWWTERWRQWWLVKSPPPPCGTEIIGIRRCRGLASWVITLHNVITFHAPPSSLESHPDYSGSLESSTNQLWRPFWKSFVPPSTRKHHWAIPLPPLSPSPASGVCVSLTSCSRVLFMSWLASPLCMLLGTWQSQGDVFGVCFALANSRLPIVFILVCLDPCDPLPPMYVAVSFWTAGWWQSGCWGLGEDYLWAYW